MTASAPSGTLPWEPLDVPGESGGPGIALRETSGEVRYLIRDAPVVRWRDGAPAVSLTLVLSRVPSPGEAVGEIVTGGTLAVEVTTAFGPETFIALAEEGSAHLPLFVRRGEFRLLEGEDAGQDALMAVESGGAAPGAAFSLSLGRDQALAVLGALDGQAADLRVSAALEFRASAAAGPLMLSAAWSDMRQALEARSDADRELAFRDVAEAVEELLSQDLLAFEASQEWDGRSLRVAGSGPALTTFLRFAAPILERLTPSLRLDDPANRYRLRAGAPAGRLEAQLIDSPSMSRSVTIEASLDRMLDGILRGFPRERFVHIVAPDPAGGWSSVAPRLVKQPRARATGGPIGLAGFGGGLRPLSHAMNPGRPRPNAAALIASDLVRPGFSHPGRLSQHWWLNDLVLTDDRPPEHLPIVAAEAPLWPDRLDNKRRWYAPEYTMVLPDRSTRAEEGPFSFTVRRVGVTSSGAPALEGDIRFTLRQGQSAATGKAIAAEPGLRADPVAVEGLGVALSIPYLDASDNSLRRNVVPAEITIDGELVRAHVALLGDNVRIAYGALAIAGFQPEPARIEVTWAHAAYVPLKDDDTRVLAGRKELRPAMRRPVGALTTLRPPGPPAPLAATHNLALANAVALQPQLALGIGLVQLAERVKYGRRSLVRRQSIDALVPCALFGALYRQDTGSGPEVVGCVDHLALGHATVGRYAEAEELAGEGYRIFRSLQQPGRFLVLPDAYRVTRFGPDASAPYRPAICVYSTLDAEVSANNRIVYHATLEPDVPPDARVRLLSELRAETDRPILEWPTAVAHEADFNWVVAGVDVEISAIRAPDHIQASFATGFAGALILRTMLEHNGIPGVVTFGFSDGSTLDARLVIELGRIIGPWESGPVESRVSEGGATLVNRIELPVDVECLLVRRESGELAEVPVDARLAPAEERRIPFDGAAAAMVAVARAAEDVTVALEEIRTYIEEIETTVVFVDLIDHPLHGIAALTIEARLRGTPGSKQLVPEGDPPKAVGSFVLPLTAFLAQHVLEFQVRKTLTDATTSATEWLEWNLAEQGTVVSLTWALIG